ncbi:MAG TPA: YmaF family protein, partial [Candidatus Agathobaculum pullicola]|nr:YmaF family protein [Candidatus Agathobaculum pullicola]
HGRSGGAIDVGGGRHVHFADAQTTQEDGRRHRFRVAALIQDPIGD